MSIKLLIVKGFNYVKRKLTKGKILGYFDGLSSVESDEKFIDYNSKNILIVLPGADKSGGGTNSLLKLGQGLQKNGFSVTYTFLSKESDFDNGIKLLKQNYNWDFKCLPLNQCKMNSYQFVISTYFTTVVSAYKVKGNHICFIQDYDAYFFERGDMDLIFQTALKKNLYCITLGSWIKERLVMEGFPASRVFPVPFPADSRYLNEDRKYEASKTIKVAVYNRRTPRRLPYFVTYLCNELAKAAKRRNIDIHFYCFGNKHDEKAPESVTDLGIINFEQAKELYQKCEFGIALSATNVSLVPFEMALSGLRLITTANDSFNSFDPDALIYSYDLDSLLDKMVEYHNLPSSEKERLNKDHLSHLKYASWDETVKETKAILDTVK